MMYLRMRSILVFWMILGLVVALASCGGKSPTGLSVPKAGRVFVRNDSDVTLRIRVIKVMETIETAVAPGEKKLVSGDDIIEGGTKVTVNVKGPVAPGWDQTTEEDIKVRVDGNVTIRVTDTGNGFIEYVIT